MNLHALRVEYSSKYLRLRRQIEDRCAECGHVGGTQLHHKIALSQGGTNDPSNLVSLCPACHGSAHNGPGAKPIGKPNRGLTVRMTLLVRPKQVKQIDDWRRQQPDLPDRNEAIRRLLNQALGLKADPQD